ncbi:MAG: hypothetical protein AAB973_04195 [Patescibacteria group bacterium]
MTIFTDDFTGTSGDNVSARTGWNKYGSGTTDVFQINASNGTKIAGTFPDDGAMYGQDPADVAHFCEAVLTSNAISSNCAAALCLRVTDRNDYLGVYYDTSSTNWRIYSFGGGSSLGTWAGAAPSGETYRAEISSAHVVTVYKDETLVNTLDVSTGFGASGQATATKVGCLAKAVTAGFDPWIDAWRSGLVSDLAGGSSIVPILNSQRQFAGA